MRAEEDKKTTLFQMRSLAEALGIPITHGWKTRLAGKLHQKKLSVLSTWIKRGVPREFENILEDANVNVDIWKRIIEHRDGKKFPLPSPLHPDPKIDALLNKTVFILESNTQFSKALHENIDSFFYAIQCVTDLSDARQKIANLDDRLKAVEIRLLSGSD